MLNNPVVGAEIALHLVVALTISDSTISFMKLSRKKSGEYEHTFPSMLLLITYHQDQLYRKKGGSKSSYGLKFKLLLHDMKLCESNRHYK